MGSRSPQRPPFMVRLALAGLSGRASAWVFVWFSLVLAVGSVFLGFWYPLAFVGVLFVLSALWYWLAIRWMDRHGDW